MVQAKVLSQMVLRFNSSIQAASGSLIHIVGPTGGYGTCAYLSIALPKSPFSQ